MRFWPVRFWLVQSWPERSWPVQTPPALQRKRRGARARQRRRSARPDACACRVRVGSASAADPSESASASPVRPAQLASARSIQPAHLARRSPSPAQSVRPARRSPSLPPAGASKGRRNRPASRESAPGSLRPRAGRQGPPARSTRRAIRWLGVGRFMRVVPYIGAGAANPPALVVSAPYNRCLDISRIARCNPLHPHGRHTPSATNNRCTWPCGTIRTHHLRNLCVLAVGRSDTGERSSPLAPCGRGVGGEGLAGKCRQSGSGCGSRQRTTGWRQHTPLCRDSLRQPATFCLPSPLAGEGLGGEGFPAGAQGPAAENPANSDYGSAEIDRFAPLRDT